MTFKDKILVFLLQRSDKAEQEYNDSLYNLRFHQVDEVDYLEVIMRKSRRDLFNEIIRDIMHLLQL